jgi:hypothetical protein
MEVSDAHHNALKSVDNFDRDGRTAAEGEGGLGSGVRADAGKDGTARRNSCHGQGLPVVPWRDGALPGLSAAADASAVKLRPGMRVAFHASGLRMRTGQDLICENADISSEWAIPAVEIHDWHAMCVDYDRRDEQLLPDWATVGSTHPAFVILYETSHVFYIITIAVNRHLF